MTAVLVGLSGMVGALLRFAADRWFERRRARRRHEVPAGALFPGGTLIVNVLGSLCIGLAWGALHTSQPDAYGVWSSGVAGGLTTFSTFSVAAVSLWEGRRRAAAVVHVLLNVVCGLAACGLGLLLAGGT